MVDVFLIFTSTAAQVLSFCSAQFVMSIGCRLTFLNLLWRI